MRPFYRRIFISILDLALFLSVVQRSVAGVKYEQSTQISGAMIEMLKRMPLVGKKFGGDFQQTMYYTADSSRTDTFQNGKLSKTEIVLLGSEKFVNLDHERRTYSELTFAEMKARLEKALQETKNAKKGDAEVSVTPKITVQDTGETKEINGYPTRHYILVLAMEIQDPKNEQKGTMQIVSDLWNTQELSAFEEQRQFYRKMAEKMGSMELYRGAAAAMSGMMQDPKMAQGLAEMKKEASKMEGTPILTVASIQMPGKLGGAPPAEAGPSESAPTSSSNPPDIEGAVSGAAKETAEEKAGNAVNKNSNAGKLFGRLGGFGGLRKKKAEPPAEAAPAPAAAKSDAVAANQPPPAAGTVEPFMKTTTELKSVEKLSFGADVFAVPAGYKQVQEK